MRYFSVFLPDDEVAAFDVAIANRHRVDIEKKLALRPKYPPFPRNSMFRKRIEACGWLTYLDEETRSLLVGTPWESRLGAITDVGLLAGCQLV